ncbi:MAG: NUDIX domain-containing protein [Ignavibacteria bacterium]|nr:NUDIX domain-containing protein [Ignavibacteria bacterium]MCC7158772.1 NUDIX domain-containing protein [Ignavibacteria bacterium]
MRKRLSAGLLMYRIKDGLPEVFLAHPGGPYFFKKDNGHWTIPKGEPDEEENVDLLVTALREFKEETGIIPAGDFVPMGTVLQKGGKEVHCWIFEGDIPKNYQHECNIYEEEWPPNSGEYREFPEIDKVEFFGIEEAKIKIKAAQIPLIDRLIEYLQSEQKI